MTEPSAVGRTLAKVMAVPWTLLATLSGPMALAQPPSQATLPPVKRAAAQWLKDVTGPG